MKEKKALVYVSESLINVKEEELKALAKQFSITNQEHNISGYLFYNGKEFLQYIEGSPKQLDQLYSNIVNDDRHQVKTCIEDDNLLHFRFMSWNMRFLSAQDLRKISVEKMMMDTLDYSSKDWVDNEEEYRQRIWKMSELLSHNQWKIEV